MEPATVQTASSAQALPSDCRTALAVSAEPLCCAQTEPSMYDHNQTLVPESFMALHSAHGRTLLSRPETEARYETCEDLALHTAAFLGATQQGPDDADEALRRCQAGLLADPSLLSAAEAGWVIERVAELQDWPRPAWLDERSRPVPP